VRVSVIQLRIGLVIAMVAEMLIFTRATGLTLIAMTVGTATTLMGMMYFYRQAAAIGILIISGAAAAAIEITSLTEVSTLLTATFGMVIPVIVLMLDALSAELDESTKIVVRRGPVLRIVGFVAASMISVPLVAFLTSIVAPGVATRLPVLTEAAIILVVAIAALTALTWREPKAVKPETSE